MHYGRVRKGILDMRLGKIPRYGWSWDKRPVRGICNIFNCNNLHYAKGFCQNHWALNVRNGKPQYKAHPPKKCKVEACNNLATPFGDLCQFHKVRKLAGVPLDLPIGKGLAGERNPRWNGGTSEYPKHSEMKRIRLEILKEANYICQYCGKLANEIHHKDQSKDNHSKDNLIACCRKCNSQIRKPHTSKYKRLYGYTAKELIEMKIFKNYYQIPVY